MIPTLAAQFIGETERLLLVVHGDAKGGDCAIIVPPFAEEMNKTRPMMAQTGQALAAAGITTVYADLLGTGDSAGRFDDASWLRWRTDVASVYRWCVTQGLRVTAFIGVRLGCALALDAARDVAAGDVKFVFWHPVVDGARAIEQFLRLRVAASLTGETKESVKELYARLGRGETIEVAGYPLSPALARDVASVDLCESAAGASSVHWIDVRPSADAPPVAATVEAIRRLREGGCNVHYEASVAAPFWSATEIVAVPALVQRTVEIIGRGA